jgi:hypothetical protein
LFLIEILVRDFVDVLVDVSVALLVSYNIPHPLDLKSCLLPFTALQLFRAGVLLKASTTHDSNHGADRAATATMDAYIPLARSRCGDAGKRILWESYTA